MHVLQIDLQEIIKMLTKHIFYYKNFKNKNISKKLKLRLKNIIIDKMLTYASETWTLTKRDREQLSRFERKVHWRILGPVYDNGKENWRILTNKEIYVSVKAYYNRDNKVKNYVALSMYRELKKIEFLKGYYIWFKEKQNWEVDQEIDGKMRWERMEVKLVEKGGKEKYITEKWKKLLRMARNRRITHMPIEWMKCTACRTYSSYHVVCHSLILIP